MNAYFKFACLYCGQRIECKPRLCGRQIQCPACLQRIVIPLTPEQKADGRAVVSPGTWDSSVPKPSVETPTRYRDPSVKYPVAIPSSANPKKNSKDSQ
jgi:hypothetical protein